MCHHGLRRPFVWSPHDHINDKYSSRLYIIGTWIITLLRKYVGEIAFGKPNSQGTETFPDGDKYEGGWKNDNKHGHGTLTISDGGKYVVEINDGDMHGHGIYTSTDGGKYVGEFKDGNFWNGTTYEIDGNIFGKWVNGKLKVKQTPLKPTPSSPVSNPH